MKYTVTLAFFAIIAVSITFAAPYEYSHPAATAGNIPKSSNAIEHSTNPAHSNKYQFVKADCQNIGSDVEVLQNKEFKVKKFVCVYPGDKPIPNDLIQEVNNHFRTKVIPQWANQW